MQECGGSGSVDSQPTACCWSLPLPCLAVAHERGSACTCADIPACTSKIHPCKQPLCSYFLDLGPAVGRTGLRKALEWARDHSGMEFPGFWYPRYGLKKEMQTSDEHISMAPHTLSCGKGYGQWRTPSVWSRRPLFLEPKSTTPPPCLVSHFHMLFFFFLMWPSEGFFPPFFLFKGKCRRQHSIY